MNTYTMKLGDADEIEEFYLKTTGMKPDFLQLSGGAIGLQHTVVELGGVTLIWTRAQGRTRWRDDMVEGALHLGLAIESSGPLIVRGQSVNREYVQVWMPGEEMDYIMHGPLLTLEIGVEPDLVKELGWELSGEPLRKVSPKPLERLIQACRRASKAVDRRRTSPPSLSENVESEKWRNLILDAMEPVLQPWLFASGFQSSKPRSDTRQYRLVRQADEFFDHLSYDTPFEVDRLVETMGVPRRTVFYAYRKLLGVGPRQYFEIKRLHTLRSRLKHASTDNATVTSIATELGFSNLGRLAALYRCRFGENPSETLKQFAAVQD